MVGSPTADFFICFLIKAYKNAFVRLLFFVLIHQSADNVERSALALHKDVTHVYANKTDGHFNNSAKEARKHSLKAYCL